MKPLRAPDLQEVRGAVVMSKVDDPEVVPGFATGVRIFLLDVSASEEPIRIRIPASENREALVEKVDSLVGKTVDVVYNRSPWSFEDKRGIINYLQSIEER